MKQNLKFVIVGHIDHGKSTLIGRLLFDTGSLPPDRIEEAKLASKGLESDIEFAFLMDHLREEREQGITIETTQTFFRTQKREYVIIDAPGHVEFVRNMITGASQADAAILIIDVEQGIQEQTKRHSSILALLGLQQTIVALNKMDLVKYSEERCEDVKTDAMRFLESINVKAEYYIPVSAAKGDNVAERSNNMDWYNGPTILESLDTLKNRNSDENKPLIFPVQDVYKINGKRIAVGKVEAGYIQAGQEIRILPGGRTTSVKSIDKFLENADRGYAGESIGITTQEPVFLDRGDVICAADDEAALTDRFKANIIWLAGGEVNKDERLLLRCATQEIAGSIEKIERRIDSSSLQIIEEDSNKLKNLELGEVIIKTKRPILVKSFNDVEGLGRFVFVKGEDVCAGGIII